MNLPEKHPPTHHQQKPHKHGWVNALSIIAIILSAISLLSNAITYATIPGQVDSYVQAHKDELKGADGKDGRDGVDGRNGVNGVNGRNSYSPTYCSSYTGSFGYTSTSCY